ncbi:MAG: UDP-N-acetylmuramoyl-L-alanine--D-glutamate ligase, partial [Candidatus Latescibacteria bacterium]|nr:UDP-N-acetylmuramoyl-L-alanine--D-glutamate ligase [Candidatus Latescibacterota bacterium]
MGAPIEKFSGMRAVVMGLGRFGGGIGAARFLAGHGARVTVTDIKKREELAESIAQLHGFDIRFVLGRHEMSDFTAAQVVVVNPAVPRESPYIAAARRSGAVLTTEIGLFAERSPAPVSGVTGSNGKSTTVSMIQSILDHSNRRYWVGGNLGGSLLPDIGAMTANDIVVLELSSFQLEWLREIGWSPHIAAILNIIPNHLDRHGTLKSYISAKASILDKQKSSDIAVLVRDEPGSRSMLDRVRGRVVWAGCDLDLRGVSLERGVIVERGWLKRTPIIDTRRLRVPGRQNAVDAMVAAACALNMDIDIDAIRYGLADFHGLPHRLEHLGEKKGVAFYNDSKSTTPESAATAVEAFGSPVIPILGGYDKGVDFDEMAGRMAGRVPWAALIG